MNKDLDFKDIGKELPYSVPEGFFNRITEKTMVEAKRRENKRAALRRRYWLAAVSVSGAAALVVLGVFSNLDKFKSGSSPLTDTLLTNNDTINVSHRDSTKETTANTGQSDKANVQTIDKVLNSMSDEDITLLAETSMNDVFLDQE